MSVLLKVDLDFSVQGLFPLRENSSEDQKCLIISKIIQELAEHSDLEDVSQEFLNYHAESRYIYLSEEKKLSLKEAGHKAFQLHKKGVSSTTAMQYYSFLIKDKKKWKV